MSSGWTERPFLEVCHAYQPKTISMNEMISGGSYPVYGANGVIGRYDKFNHEKAEILLGCRGSCGAINISEPQSWVTGNAMVIRPKNGEITRPFLKSYLEGASRFAGIITGVAQPQITRKSLSALKIIYPSLIEQGRIAAVLDEAFTGLATVTSNAERNLENARELFDSYLSSVFETKGEGWDEKKLSELCREMTVGHVGTMAKRYKPAGIPFLRSQNVRPFQVALNDVVYIDEAFHRELAKSQLRPGDVTIVRTGYPGTAAVIPDTLKISNCADLVIIRCGDQLDPRYLAAFFNSSYGKRLVSGNLNGAAQKHFNVTSAKAVKISLPPRKEQERRVGLIEELRAQTRALELGYETKKQRLADLKQIMLQKAFSGELIPSTPQTIKEAAE